MMYDTKVIWKDIPGTQGYQVSNFGDVISWKHLPDYGQGLVLKPDPLYLIPQVKDYRYFRLYVNGRQRTFTAGILVLQSFKGPRPTGAVVKRNDGDTYNDFVGNLKWGYRKDGKDAND